MKFKIDHIIIFYFLLNLFLFDLQTKLLDIPFYANDILLLGLLVYFLKFRIRIPKWSFFLIASLAIIIVVQLLKFNNSFLVRDLQFILRILTAVLTSILIRKHLHFTRELIIKFSKILLIIGYLAFFLLFFGLDILPYTSGRNFMGTRQFSSVFSEPALYGLSSFFFLHFIYPELKDLKMHKNLLIGIIFSIILSQSLGAIFGLFIWAIHLLFKLEKKIMIFRYTLILVLGAVLTFNVVITYFPESRISMAYLFSGHNEQLLDRSGTIRVTNEFFVLSQYFERNAANLFFGGDIETEQIRKEYSLTDLNVGNISGNGIVEFILRYGIVSLILIIIPIFPISAYSFLIIFLTMNQIDGAIGKPYIFSFIILLASTYDRKCFSNNLA